MNEHAQRRIHHKIEAMISKEIEARVDLDWRKLMESSGCASPLRALCDPKIETGSSEFQRHLRDLARTIKEAQRLLRQQVIRANKIAKIARKSRKAK